MHPENQQPHLKTPETRLSYEEKISRTTYMPSVTHHHFEHLPTRSLYDAEYKSSVDEVSQHLPKTIKAPIFFLDIEFTD